MNIYLAARFSKRNILQEWQPALEALGHTIVSRWSMRGSDHIKAPGLSERAADSERLRFATEDIEDIEACDCVISLMEEPRSNGRGGRHVEFGYALAKGKRLIIVGERETVFHHLPQVEHYSNWGDCWDALQEEQVKSLRCDKEVMSAAIAINAEYGSMVKERGEYNVEFKRPGTAELLQNYVGVRIKLLNELRDALGKRGS